jgi:hypothetical protein
LWIDISSIEDPINFIFAAYYVRKAKRNIKRVQTHTVAGAGERARERKREREKERKRKKEI